eukprot:Rhum_TRINITY_DN14664_c1_g7::Rhum_TRINITY_DN14664_c1_g7_i3::g.103311::m.103311
MAPWWTWPVVKASLTFLSMIFCIVVAAVGTSSFVSEQPSGPSTGMGVFTIKVDDATAKSLGSTNPVDFWATKVDQWGKQTPNGKEMRCKPFKIMWQTMQGCVIIAIIGCFASTACSLSLLAFKEHNGARNCVSWIVDLLALLGAAILTSLLIIVFFIQPCQMEKSLSEGEGNSLGFGAYLAGVSTVLIFVSLFLPAKSGSKPANLSDNYQNYNDYNAQPMQQVGSPAYASSPSKSGVGHL